MKQCGGTIKSREDLQKVMEELKVGCFPPPPPHAEQSGCCPFHMHVGTSHRYMQAEVLHSLRAKVCWGVVGAYSSTTRTATPIALASLDFHQLLACT